MSVLGIDIGTTGCKALVVDEDGHPLAFSRREYPLQSPECGWAELDSAGVMNACFEVIAEAAGAVGGDHVEAIGMSTQGEAFTPVDADGEVLANAMVSSDTRADEFLHECVAEFGAERLYRITGHTPHPMFTLFKLLWTKHRRPEVWNKAALFLCFEDLLCMRLGLPPSMGWPLAGRTMLFDVNSREWSQSILAMLDLDPTRLATPLASGSVVGELADPMCRRLGVRHGCLVVSGGHDQTCTGLGAGAIGHGVAVYGTGTVECITPAMRRAIFSEKLMENNLCMYQHAAPGMYATVAFSLTGGNLLQWFRDEFGQLEMMKARREGTDPYSLLLQQVPQAPARPMVLPYFTPSGTPHFDLQTAGAVVGLRLSTTRGEFLKALLEGVSFEMRLNLELLNDAGIGINELRAVGGAAVSQSLMQLKADVLNRPIRAVGNTEAGCFGAAMLARAARGDASVADVAARWVQLGVLLEPETDRARHYEDRFQEYRTLYCSMRAIDAGKE